MQVTASGVPKSRRQALQALVERLHGTWSGALQVGATAVVVVEGPLVDWAAPKLAVAAHHGIPIVTSEWLLDSETHGFLLSTAPYCLAPGQQARRSSAASTSLLPAATAPQQPSCAAAAAPPASPEVELEALRGEAPAPSPLAPPFLQRSPAAAAGRPGGTAATRGHLSPAPDALPQCTPPSPASLPWLSPLDLDARLDAVLPSELGGEAEALRGSSGLNTSAGLEVTPMARCAASSGTPPPGDTDSSAKVARFLSRAPCITLLRGTRLRVPPPPSSGSGSAGTSIRSSLSGGGPAGAAGGSPGCFSIGDTGLPAQQLQLESQSDAEAEEGAEEPCAEQPRWPAVPASPATQLSAAAEHALQLPSARAQAPAVGAEPQLAPPALPRRWRSQSVMRARPAAAHSRLPATTLIRLGPRLQRRLPRSTLEGVAERHGAVAAGGGESASQRAAPVPFFESAEARLADGTELRFVAGKLKAWAVLPGLGLLGHVLGALPLASARCSGRPAPCIFLPAARR